MRADLHVHSTASDGTLSPRDLVYRAHANGVGVLALADHDSIGGLAEARLAADATGTLLVPAAELSANSHGRDVHILAYFLDPTSPQLAEELSALRVARQERAEAIVDALDAAGYAISMDAVRAIAGEGSVGRSHVARALVEAGHARTTTEAFQRFIGRSQPFYVAKRSASPAEVTARIRGFGGLAVLAHPGVTAVDDVIGEMVEAGLAGIEAYHSDHDAEQRQRYAALAAQLGVLVTGGSDYHGPQGPNPDVGSVEWPLADVEAFLAAGRALASR